MGYEPDTLLEVYAMIAFDILKTPVVAIPLLTALAWSSYCHRHEIDDSIFHKQRPSVSIEKDDCNYRNWAKITLKSRSGSELSNIVIYDKDRKVLEKKLSGMEDKAYLNDDLEGGPYDLYVEDEKGNKAKRDFRIIFREPERRLSPWN